MTRTSDDNWDFTTGVGAAAASVAASRAVASRGPDRLISDPFAEVLVRELGLKLFKRTVDGRIDLSEIGATWLAKLFGIRSRAFDDFVGGACDLGIRQLVVLASGLDCRAYRFRWPADMSIYEVDQPAVVQWKQCTLARLGAASTAHHHLVGSDLRQDWSTALCQAGFDAAKPTAWIVEGLLIGYLPPSAQDAILDAITALSARGSRITADHVDVRHPNVITEFLSRFHDLWSKPDAGVPLPSLTSNGPRHDPAVYLAKRGWITHNNNLNDLYRAAGRPVPAANDYPAESEFMLFLDGIRY